MAPAGAAGVITQDIMGATVYGWRSGAWGARRAAAGAGDAWIDQTAAMMTAGEQ